MKFRLSSITLALGCILIASCYPYDESQQQKPVQNQEQKTVTTPEQQKLQEQRDKMKAKEKVAKNEETTEDSTGTTTTTPGDTTKPPVEEKRDYAIANKVPGKEGFVFSPYNNKVIDVRDMPSGTLVQDPTYTGAGKGYFRVP